MSVLTPRKFLCELIELYKSHPCLWQIKNKDYSNRNKKELAYTALVRKFREIDPTADRNTVSKKINALRTVYKKELRKVNNSLKSGVGEDDLYKPTLWYFDQLHFIYNQDCSPSSRSALDEEDKQEDNNPDAMSPEVLLDQSASEPASPVPPSGNEYRALIASGPASSFHPPSSRPNVKKRKITEVEEATKETLLLTGKQIEMIRSEDPHDIFGKHVADRLRGVRPDQVKFAQKLISDVLFEADMESLNRFCKIVTAELPSSCSNDNSTTNTTF